MPQSVMVEINLHHLRLVGPEGRRRYEVQLVVPQPLREKVGKATLTYNTKKAKGEEADAAAIRDAKLKEFEATLEQARQGERRYTHWEDPYFSFGGGMRIAKYPQTSRTIAGVEVPVDFNLATHLRQTVSLPKSGESRKADFTDILDAWARDGGRAQDGKADPKDKGVQAKQRAFKLYMDWRKNPAHQNLAAIVQSDLFAYRRHLIDQVNAGQMKSKTAEDYLFNLKAIFTYAHREQKITTNPGEGVSYKGSTDPSDKYQDFSDADIALILSEARKAEPFIRWFHWLGAYSGARCAEVSEARVRDVEIVGGVPVFHIRRLYRPGKMHTLKTDEISERPVPLHAAVIAEGFLEYVAAIREKHGPDEALFPCLKLYNGRLNADASNRSMAWLRSIGIKEKKKVNHSWRHTIKTCFRHVMEEQFSDFLTGHSNGKEGRDYGKYPIPLLAKQIANVPTWKVSP